jgi:transcriptional regulator with XRE-family HTH domain
MILKSNSALQNGGIFLNIFADKLKLIRKQNKISQTELARKLGISQNQVSKYEQGRDIPSGAILLKMTQVLKVSSEYLLGKIHHADLEGKYQFMAAKRSNLFKAPEGELQYDYFLNGEEQTSIFSYVFGIFFVSEHKIAGLDSRTPAPILPSEFQPLLFLREKSGHILSTMLEANDDFVFGSLSGFLNETFALGSCYFDSSSQSQVQLITHLKTDNLQENTIFTGSKKYTIISAYRGCKVRNYAVDSILEAFLDFYLPLPIAKKIMFLERV